MSKLVLDPKALPDRSVPIPGTKPPVVSLPFQDLGNPEEVDTFRRRIRQLRRQTGAEARRAITSTWSCSQRCSPMSAPASIGPTSFPIADRSERR
jgi:hypothetical protein